MALIVIERIIPSQLVSKKQRDDEDKRDTFARSKSFQKSLAHYFHFPLNDRTKRYDTRYRSRSTSRNSFFTRNNKLDIALHLEIFLVMTKILLLHNTLNQDMTIINETRNLIALLIDHPTKHIIDVVLAIDIDYAHTQDTTIILRDKPILLDHL